MVLCSHCEKNVSGVPLEHGYVCCETCGRIISSNCVRTIQSELSASLERTLERVKDEIINLCSLHLGVHDESVADQALTFYRMALERNFIRGRKPEDVQAACLYIAFRLNNKPYILTDFSNLLRTDVYVLGAVLLELCQVVSTSRSVNYEFIN